jgi:hypothetical protein
MLAWGKVSHGVTGTVGLTVPVDVFWPQHLLQPDEMFSCTYLHFCEALKVSSAYQQTVTVCPRTEVHNVV